jgi:hypothetical protein
MLPDWSAPRFRMVLPAGHERAQHPTALALKPLMPSRRNSTTTTLLFSIRVCLPFRALTFSACPW